LRALLIFDFLKPTCVLRPNYGSEQEPRRWVEAKRDSGHPLCLLQLAELVLAELPRARIPLLFRDAEIADRLLLPGSEPR
jgi:hypothetical protein